MRSCAFVASAFPVCPGGCVCAARNLVLEELENVPTSCQLRGEWGISDEERLSSLEVEGPCTQPGLGRAEEAYNQMQPDEALDRLPRVELVNPCSCQRLEGSSCDGAFPDS